MLMEAIMKRFTHIEFTTAQNAEIGLALIESLPPDLLLLDINLPGMNGYQALAQLKRSKHTRDLPVIAMTANAFKADIKRVEEAGFSGHLTKPVSIRALQDVLDKYLKV
jgi:CheY-like chemotaxis protein